MLCRIFFVFAISAEASIVFFYKLVYYHQLSLSSFGFVSVFLS